MDILDLIRGAQGGSAVQQLGQQFGLDDRQVSSALSAWPPSRLPSPMCTSICSMTLITDDRFSNLSRTVGGLTTAQLTANRAALAPLPAGAETVDGPILVEPDALRRLGFMSPRL